MYPEVIIPGHPLHERRDFLKAFGYRESMGTTATGEDIWPGTAAAIPVPAAAGEQLAIVSSDAADNPSGTGVGSVRVHYLDVSGVEQTEDVTLNGDTEVVLSASNVRFVNDLYSLTVGSNGVAEGDITIYQDGDVSRIYNMIALGGNKSLVPNRMVPFGKRLHLQGWHCEEAKAKRVSFRIRSTDMNGDLIDGVFCFKDSVYLKQSASGMLTLYDVIPALSIIKVSGWADELNAEGSCGWWGILEDYEA